MSLAFGASALAQAAAPAELTALQRTFAFDDQLKKVKEDQQAAIDALQLPYAKSLDALQAKLQKAGDLNGLEVVAKEATRFKADGHLNAAQVSEVQPDLRAVQEKYLAETARIDMGTHLRIFALRAQYAARIAELQKRLTMAGRIEDAKAVRSEFVRVAAQPDVAAAAIAAKGEFEKDYAKYKEDQSRNTTPSLKSKTDMEKAWQALCKRWNVADAGRTPGTLTWNGDDGLVQIASAPRKPPILPPPNLAIGQAWTNSLGMEFVPVPGTDVLFCKWETRLQDWAAFAKDKELTWEPPSGRGPTHPVCGVSWNDAQAFCKWLTQKEQKEGTIRTGQEYRLPRDWEWSVAVGLDEARKGAPKDKNSAVPNVYPWGNTWPPPENSGNYAAAFKADSFPATAPVGTFAPNRYGIADMGGNVAELCEDCFNGVDGARVLRGGSYASDIPAKYLSSVRYPYDATWTGYFVGFRCVVTRR